MTVDAVGFGHGRRSAKVGALGLSLSPCGTLRFATGGRTSIRTFIASWNRFSVRSAQQGVIVNAARVFQWFPMDLRCAEVIARCTVGRNTGRC